jgi:hypothetical protein
MTTRNHTTGPLVLTIALAITLLPAAALAQAGLSGDPFSGQEAERLGLGNASKWDNGSLRGTSALGQLEQISGGKVNRPSSQRTVIPRAAQQARSVTPRFDSNQMFRQELAGAVVGALFASIFQDNSAQERAAAEAAAAQRAAQAAQAAAEAEAFRVQQELARQARFRQAQRYRAEWDARETEVADRLGGAFDVTPATSFFGRPANPDADVIAKILSQDVAGGAPPASGGVPDPFASDPSVVDLRGSSLVVQPFQPPTGVAINGRNPMVPPLPTRASVTPPWGDNWQEPEPPPEDPGKLGKWWTHVRSYTGDKVTELGWAELFLGIKEAGGNSIDALASIPEKAKAAFDLKKNLEKSVNRSVGSTFSMAEQLTNFRANGDGLVNRSDESLHTDVTNFTDNAKKGIFDNLSINVAPEGAVSETGVGIAQGVNSDLADWMKWGKN